MQAGLDDCREGTRERHATRLGAGRYVVGTFQVNVLVGNGPALLADEENTLAILKWRLAQTRSGERWRQVLARYVEYLAGRVNAFGGNPEAILASLAGYRPPGHHHAHPPHHPAHVGELCTVGKVVGVAL